MAVSLTIGVEFVLLLSAFLSSCSVKEVEDSLGFGCKARVVAESP